MKSTLSVLAGALLAATMLAGPASAGLLGDVLGGAGDAVGGVVDDVLGDGLVTVSGDEAKDSGLVNIGLGGGNGNLVDANVAPDSGLVKANVSTGGGNGLLDVDADVGNGLVGADVGVGQDDGLVDAHVGVGRGAVTADVNVGGDSLVDVGVGIGGGGGGDNGGGGNGGGGNGGGGNGGGGNGGGGNGGGGNGGGGNGGGGNGGGGNGGGGNGGGGNGGGGNGIIGNGGGRGGNGGAVAGTQGCVGTDPYRALSLFQGTAVTNSAISAWHSANNVRVFPVKLCGPQRNQLAATVSTSPKLGIIQTSIMTAPAISSALTQAGYNPRNVFAIGRNAGQVVVYVY